VGKHSAESRQKMSEARRQWWMKLTPEEKVFYAQKQRKTHPKTNGITTATNKEVSRLKAEIQRMKERLKELGEDEDV